MKRILGVVLLAILRGLATIVKTTRSKIRPEIHKTNPTLIPKHADQKNASHVAVLVPTFNGWDWTEKCLASLLLELENHEFDIWVIDDASTDGTPEKSTQIDPRIKVLRSDNNKGFLLNCNSAFVALRKQYEFFFLLNNDTEVLPGFLWHSLALANKRPDAALVGSKLVYSDGTLQEAGGLFWRDGNAWNFGRDGDPDAPEFNIDRQVDYCSGAALLLRTDALAEVGFFSEEFLPAYCEDSDLAFKLRAAGYQTWYCHDSVVVHHEGKSHGTDASGGIKEFQKINSEKLAKKWANELTEHLEEDPSRALEAAFRLSPEFMPGGKRIYVKGNFVRVPKKLLPLSERLYNFYRLNQNKTYFEILYPHRFSLKQRKTAALSPKHNQIELDVPPNTFLMVEQEVPKFDTNAGDLTVFSYITAIAKTGINVSLLVPHGYETSKYSDVIESHGVEIVSPDVPMASWLERNKKNISGLWISRPELANSLLRTFQNLELSNVVYYTHDLHHDRLIKQAKKNFSIRKACEAALVRRKELRIINSVKMVASPSFQESKVIQELNPKAIVKTIPPYIWPDGNKRNLTPQYFESKTDVLFVGGYRHTPNIDAALFLANKVMPKVWQIIPRARLVLAGSHPTPAIQDLSGQRIFVPGYLESLANTYAEARVVAAPLRFGAGVKGKTVEALRFGVPVVGTPIAFEGIFEDTEAIGIQGNTAQELADGIIQMLLDPAECARIANEGAKYVSEKFSESAAQDAILGIFESLGIQLFDRRS
jgi:GT2 family glycosyltransferase